MSLRPFILISLLANVALAIAALIQPARTARLESIVHRPGVVTHRVIVFDRSQGSKRNAKPQEVPASFHWSQLESADYRTYIANLRAIGCPKATIRELIEAEVNEQFTHRRTEIAARVQAHLFWEGFLHEPSREWTDANLEKPMEDLKTDRNAVLKDLFGGEADLETTLLFEPDANLRRLVGYLPESKQLQVLNLEEKYKRLDYELRQRSGGNVPAGEVRELQTQKLAEQRALLSPEEMKEFQLRSSGHAHWAANLDGFDATEAELIAVAKARLRVEELSVKGPARLQQIEEQTRSALGDDRYAEFQRAQNRDFQLARQVIERFSLPAETAVKVYELRQAAEQQAASLMRMDLSGETRLAAAAAIQAETERSLRGTLGGNAYSLYEKSSGGWLKALGQPPMSTARP
jgi:hypothetical protein